MKNYYKYVFTILILLLINKTSFTQEKVNSIKKETFWQLMKYDGASAFGGIKHAYSRPFHWKKDDLFTVGGIVLGTALLYSFDKESSDFFIKQENDIPKTIKDFGFYFGKPKYNYGLSVGIYGFGLLTRNEKFRHTGVLLIASATASGFIQTLSKNIVGRARPSAEKGTHFFKLFSSEASHHSFPSGHSMLSFTTAHAIAKQFDNYWIKGGIYAIGSISPVSRLWSGSHWLTDVALGMVISVVIVDSIDNYLKSNNRYKLKKERNITWNLILDHNRLGLRGTF